jgi:1-acyl-sn-glycerol-3-phosphate acyltransferase
MAEDWTYEPLQSLPPEALAANSRLMNASRDQCYRLIRWWLTRRFRFSVDGAERVARLPQCVLVANHTSHLDTLCLLAALPPAVRNRCYSAAAEDYFYTNIFKEQAARLLANTFPFRRHGDTQQSLAACVRVLARGDSLIFYPEGTRSTTGRLQPFRRGIGLLVQGTPYPVVPAHLEGAYDAMAKGRLLPKAAVIRLRFGQAECFREAPPGRESAEAIAAKLEQQVRVLGTSTQEGRA